MPIQPIESLLAQIQAIRTQIRNWTTGSSESLSQLKKDLSEALGRLGGGDWQ